MTREKNSASPPPGTDARGLPRFKMDVGVRVSVSRTGQLIHARSTDLSEGGLAFFAPVELGVGEVLALEFTLPYTRHPQRCRAIVRNRSGHRYGVEFQQVPEAMREVIARACKALSLLV